MTRILVVAGTLGAFLQVEIAAKLAENGVAVVAAAPPTGGRRRALVVNDLALRRLDVTPAALFGPIAWKDTRGGPWYRRDARGRPCRY